MFWGSSAVVIKPDFTYTTRLLGFGLNADIRKPNFHRRCDDCISNQLPVPTSAQKATNNFRMRSDLNYQFLGAKRISQNPNFHKRWDDRI